MSEKSFCTQLYSIIGKYNFQIDKYALPIVEPSPISLRRDHFSLNDEEDLNKQTSNFEAFKRKKIPVQPSICLWSFLCKHEIIQIKETKDKELTLKIIGDKLNKGLITGNPRLFLQELMFSIIQFSDKYNFNTEQTGVVLSMFYNTHQYFTYDLWISAEEIYKLFKEYIFFHSIFLPPWRIKIFCLSECKQIILYFCQIYLRNLPLIRLMALPNYGFLLEAKDTAVIEENKKKKSVSSKKKGKKQ